MFHTFKNQKIHYTDSGNGTEILLLHGYLESSAVWNGFGEKLISGFRVISIDLPGHGRSDLYGETHTMEFMAGVIKDLIDNLGIKKIFLVGHSLGGYVTLAFLDLFPEYLSGYCLFHSHPLADPPEIIEKRIREINIVKAGKKDIMCSDVLTRMYAASNLEKFSATLSRSKEIASRIPGNGIIAMLNGMMKRPSRQTVMEEGRVPFLWILGTMDNYIQCEILQSKVKLPSNAKLVVFKNSGHLGFIEEEDLSVKIVSDFVRTFAISAQ